MTKSFFCVSESEKKFGKREGMAEGPWFARGTFAPPLYEWYNLTLWRAEGTDGGLSVHYISSKVLFQDRFDTADSTASLPLQVGSSLVWRFLFSACSVKRKSGVLTVDAPIKQLPSSRKRDLSSLVFFVCTYSATRATIHGKTIMQRAVFAEHTLFDKNSLFCFYLQ